jgi:hypothetical protein
MVTVKLAVFSTGGRVPLSSSFEHDVKINIMQKVSKRSFFIILRID